MKKILFPTEFSDHAPQMFHYALQLAKKYDSELVLMHAYGKPEPLVTNVDDETREQRVLTKLKEFAGANTPREFKRVPLRYIAQLDYPADAILAAAEREKPDMIVLGMTGKTDDINSHLGSNALKVIRMAECPVLAIPSTIRFQPVKKIVFTTDFEFEDLIALNWLKEAYDAHVTTIHVLESEKKMPRAKRRIQALETAYNGHRKMSFELINQEDVEEAIESYVEGKKADLLAMTSHKRSLVSLLIEGSTTRDIARHTKTPLLVFKFN